MLIFLMCLSKAKKCTFRACLCACKMCCLRLQASLLLVDDCIIGAKKCGRYDMSHIFCNFALACIIYIMCGINNIAKQDDKHFCISK